MKNIIFLVLAAIMIAATANAQQPDNARGFKKVTNISNDSKGVVIKALNGQAINYDPQKIIIMNAEDEDRMHRPDRATPETFIDVSEIISDKTFLEMYTGLADSLDKMTLTQPQIMTICNQYFRRLAQDECQNIFLTKINGEYFIIMTKMGANDSLVLSYFPLNYDYVWHRETQRRIFYPRL